MSSSTSPEGGATAFGPFLLLPAERLLLEDGRPVHIGSRAMGVLIALVRRAGELVSKDELVAAVWPGVLVDEVNLRVNVSLLRRALRDGLEGRRYLQTVPGLGYRFIGQCSSRATVAPDLRQKLVPPLARTVPTSLTRLIGREEIVRLILAQLQP